MLERLPAVNRREALSHLGYGTLALLTGSTLCGGTIPFLGLDSSGAGFGGAGAAWAQPPAAPEEGAAAGSVPLSDEFPAGTDPRHPLVPVLKMAYESRAACAAIKDYSATFVKQEWMGRKMIKTTMNIKLREQPFSVYLLFAEPNKGREVIYVQGRNNNQLQAHEAGLLSVVGTLSLIPTSPDAMNGNKYPVTMIGLRNMLEQLIVQWEAETKFGEVQTKYYPQATLGQIECKVLETRHPNPRKQFKHHLTRLYLDAKTLLPLRVEQYDFPSAPDKPAPLMEEYTYFNLQTNIGLTDLDFDTRNPGYAFSK